jgi:hypothetical protein
MNGWILLQMMITWCRPRLLLFSPSYKKFETQILITNLQDDVVEHLWRLKAIA